MGELLMASGLILVGFMVLIAGGEILVRGATGLSVIMRISPLIVGLTVVAFCTSAPELAVSLQSALAGEAALAVGNVVGSCICNVLLVLGLSALVAPLVVSMQMVRWDVPIMIAATGALWAFGRGGVISRGEGAVLFGALVAYVIWSIYVARKERSKYEEEFGGFAPVSDAPPKSAVGGIVINLILIAVGVLCLHFASKWLVDGSTVIARYFGIGELLIGLTILAIGTSLPEMVVSVVAALRGKRDLAVGNVVGSNIFNILCVIGLTSIFSPAGLEVSSQALWFDIPVALAVAAICLPIFFSGYLIARWEGALLVVYYVAYLTYIVVEPKHPEQADHYGRHFLMLVVPASLLLIGGSVVYSLRARQTDR